MIGSMPTSNVTIDLLDIVIPATEAGITVDLYVQHKDKSRKPNIDNFVDVQMPTIQELLGQIDISKYTVDSMDYKRKANKLTVRMSQQITSEPQYREAKE